MARDFIDKDLMSLSRSSRAAEPEAAMTVSPISRDGMAKMAQQKSELNHQVADAVHEIEELRQRQSQLEREKRDLEELGRKQDEYSTAKREIAEQLAGSILLLEKEEMQASRMLELFGVIRSRFKDSLTEVRSITEDGWSEDAYQMELNQAIVIVEDARNTYKKGIAKMEAAGWHGKHSGGIPAPAAVAEKIQKRNFGYWFKVGIAVSIPFIIFQTILFILGRWLDGFI